MDPYVYEIWNQPNINYSEVVGNHLRRTEAGMLALRLELNHYLRSLRPNKGKNMNEITTLPNMDNDQIAALMAELHAGDIDTIVSDGEATPEEGAFVSEDEASVPVAIN